MLIVEGPDGSGKSTLVRYLRDRIGWPVASRVVDKDTNAMVDITEWTKENLAKGFHPMIYDRHRLISELVYGPIMRRSSEFPEFYNDRWLIPAVSDFWDAEPWVIMCLPPLSQVISNLEGDEDNKAVIDYIDQLYRGYVGLTAHMCHFSRELIVFDYTTEHMDKVGRVVEGLIKGRKALHHV